MSVAAHMTRKRNNACLVQVYKYQIDKPMETAAATRGGEGRGDGSPPFTSTSPLGLGVTFK